MDGDRAKEVEPFRLTDITSNSITRIAAGMGITRTSVVELAVHEMDKDNQPPGWTPPVKKRDWDKRTAKYRKAIGR